MKNAIMMIAALLLSSTATFAATDYTAARNDRRVIVDPVKMEEAKLSIGDLYRLELGNGKSVAAKDIALSAKNLQALKVYVDGELHDIIQADRVTMQRGPLSDAVRIHNSGIGSINRTLTFAKPGKYHLDLVWSAGGKLAKEPMDVAVSEYGCDIASLEPLKSGQVKVVYEVVNYFSDPELDAALKYAKVAEVYINGYLNKGAEVVHLPTGHGVSVTLSQETVDALSKMSGVETHIEIDKFDVYGHPQYSNPFTEHTGGK